MTEVFTPLGTFLLGGIVTSLCFIYYIFKSKDDSFDQAFDEEAKKVLSNLREEDKAKPKPKARKVKNDGSQKPKKVVSSVSQLVDQHHKSDLEPERNAFLAGHLEKLNSQVSSLSEARDAANDASTTTSNRIEEHETARIHHESIHAMREEIERLKHENTRLEKQNTRLSVENGYLIGNNAAILGQNSKLRNKLDDCKNQVMKFGKVRDALKNAQNEISKFRVEMQIIKELTQKTFVEQIGGLYDAFLRQIDAVYKNNSGLRVLCDQLRLELYTSLSKTDNKASSITDVSMAELDIFAEVHNLFPLLLTKNFFDNSSSTSSLVSGLLNMKLGVADSVQPLSKQNFNAAWDAIEGEGEQEKTFQLTTVSTIAEAIKKISDQLGLAPCERSDRVPEGRTQHTTLLAGVFRGGHEVLAKATVAIDPSDRSINMNIVIRSKDHVVPELVASAIA